MKEISKEIIEVDGKEYTLFLNRKGIIAWEKYCKEENKKINTVKSKYQEFLKSGDNVEITDETNPFEGIEDLDSLNEDEELVRKTFKKLYWIMLYTEHKMSMSEVEEWYNKAINEYYETDLILLGKQMIEDANIDPNANKQLKNLSALRQAK